MLISVTCLKLRSPFKIPLLIRYSATIFKQLESTNCLGVKTRGIWKNHYTMTQWESYEEMRDFAKSGAHKEAMKMSKTLAKEILVLSFEQDDAPSWKEVRKFLKEDGSIYRY